MLNREHVSVSVSMKILKRGCEYEGFEEGVNVLKSVSRGVSVKILKSARITSRTRTRTHAGLNVTSPKECVIYIAQYKYVVASADRISAESES